MRCLEHMKVIEILRLKEMNLFTYRDIVSSVDCSKTTVREILSRCKKHGLTYADASYMTQDQINEIIYPESFGPRQVKDEPDWDAIHKHLTSSKKSQPAVHMGRRIPSSISGVDGPGRIEKISFEAYNRSEALQDVIERYYQREDRYPERVLADKIYRNRANLQYCKSKGSRLSGPSLG